MIENYLLYGIMDIRERETVRIVFIQGVEDIENKDGVTVTKRQLIWLRMK